MLNFFIGIVFGFLLGLSFGVLAVIQKNYRTKKELNILQKENL